MTDPDAFQRVAEAEIQKCRNLGNLGALPVMAQPLPPDYHIAYGLVLAPFGYPGNHPHSQTGLQVQEQARLSACRLALFALHFDSGVPRWSSWMLSSIITGLQPITHDRSCVLLKAMWQLLIENDPPLTRELAQFVKDVVRNLLSRRTNKSDIDMPWLTPLPEALSPAQAYFVFNALALKPEIFTQELEERIAATLKGTNFYHEIRPARS